MGVLSSCNIALDIIHVTVEELFLILEDSLARGFPWCQSSGEVVEPREGVYEVTTRNGSGGKFFEKCALIQNKNVSIQLPMRKLPRFKAYHIGNSRIGVSVGSLVEGDLHDERASISLAVSPESFRSLEHVNHQLSGFQILHWLVCSRSLSRGELVNELSFLAP